MRFWLSRSGTSMLSIAFFAVCSVVAADSPLNSLLSSRSLVSRQADVTQVVQPISFAPSQYWEGNDGPWSTFPLQIGVSPQLVRVLPSTSSYNNWAVAPGGCPSFYPSSCPVDRGGLYNANRSPSWTAFTSLALGQELALGYNTTAVFGFDQVTLGWHGSGGPSINNATVAYYYDASEYFLGAFGLNPQSTNFSDGRGPHQSYLSSLKYQNLIPSLSYGYTAGNRYRLNQVYGSLTLGGYDSARMTSRMVTFAMNKDPSRDLLVDVAKVQLASHGVTQVNYTKPFNAVIDSTIPYLYLPLDLCQVFEKTFGLIYNSTLDMYLVNASLHDTLIQSNPLVTLALVASDSTAVDIPLPYGAFDLTTSYPTLGDGGQSSFYFPIRRGANDTQYVLGRAFLQEAYLIADYERRNFTIAPCAWDANIMNANITTIFSTEMIKMLKHNRHSRITGRAIGGIVIGLIVSLVLLGLAIFYFLRHRQRKLKDGWEQEFNKDQGQPRVAGLRDAEPQAIELSGRSIVYELGDNHHMVNPFDAPHELDGRPQFVDAKELPADEYPSELKDSIVEAHELQGSHVAVYELDGTPVLEHSPVSPEQFGEIGRNNFANESWLVSPVSPESDTPPDYPAIASKR
ncbi:acid protease [Myriangium duriaei CBS 260.36]|uniref:Acid protease n=1 Tax=Myriangium duriaei CBS 260.36 TaxID=1168546 RepID=A0A9P4J2Q7_9PEZI|nr:acid protease [Myriangium duriaei CBS 260.36]